MVMITILNKILPRKFALSTSQQARDIHEHQHPEGCFWSEGYGAFLRSHDGRIIPLRKASFLQEKTKHIDMY